MDLKQQKMDLMIWAQDHENTNNKALLWQAQQMKSEKNIFQFFLT